MNKKELLNEFLKNFPELEKDKKSLEKTLDFMLKNNPKVEIDEKFKQNLKKKLETISDLKMNKDTSSIWFLLPIFWFLFSIFALFYMFFNVSFFHNSNIKDLEIKEKSTKTLNPQYENLNFSSNNLNSDLEKPLNNDFIKTRSVENSENTWWKKSSPIIEDNQILEFVEDLEKNNLEEKLYATDSITILKSFKYKDFQDFCKSNSWTLIRKNLNKTCKKKNKYCLEENYKDWYCEWKEK